MNPAIEIIAFACGVAGTLLLAVKGDRAGWGFVAFLGSNAAWISFAMAHQHWWLLAQHVVFMGTSLLGIYVWLLHRRLRVFRKHYRIARRYSSRWGAIRNGWMFTRLVP